MCWQNLKYRCRDLFETKIITGKKPGDRKALLLLIAEEFPEFPRLRVAHVIDKFMETKSHPISANEFVDFMKGYLN